MFSCCETIDNKIKIDCECKEDYIILWYYKSFYKSTKFVYLGSCLKCGRIYSLINEINKDDIITCLGKIKNRWDRFNVW